METPCLYEFGPFVLDPFRRELLKDGQPLPLGSHAFEVLSVLVGRRGVDVTRAELHELVWPGTVSVEERTLNVHIAALRKALGETASSHNYVLTLPGRGYRFIAPVRERPRQDQVETILSSRSKKRVLVEEEIEEITEDDENSAIYVDETGATTVSPAQPSPNLTVKDNPNHTKITDALASIRRAPLSRPLVLRIVAAAALAGAVAILGIRRFSNQSLNSDSALKMSELTTNAPADAVADARISPDGKYFAYIDNDGIHLQIIATSELHPIPMPVGAHPSYVSWFPNSTDLLVGTEAAAGGAAPLWAVSIFGGQPRKLVEDAGEASVSPDGSQLAITSKDGQEIWLYKPDGEEERKLVVAVGNDTFQDLAWTKSSRYPVFARLHTASYRFDVSIESVDIKSGRTTQIVSSSGLTGVRGMCLSPDGRMFYSQVELPPNQTTSGLWELRVDPETGRALGKPRRIGKWAGTSLLNLSISHDGKRLLFLKGTYEADAYVADIAKDGARLSNVRRLTLDGANDLPTAWTPDSRSILFHSDRSDKWQIFKQSLDQLTPQLVATDQGDDKGARVTADGKSILYFSRPKNGIWTWAEPTRLIQTPLSAGPSRVLLNERGLYSVRCARRPSALCVLGERSLRQLTFFLLDPAQGKGAELAQTTVKLSLDQDNWDLSPDGSTIAIALGGNPDGRIRLLSLQNQQTRDIFVRGRSAFQSMDWAANGKGLYVSSRTASGSDLLYIDLQGRATLVTRQEGSFMTWGVPSPDGKHLAFLQWTALGNAWMIENF